MEGRRKEGEREERAGTTSGRVQLPAYRALCLQVCPIHNTFCGGVVAALPSFLPSLSLSCLHSLSLSLPFIIISSSLFFLISVSFPSSLFPTLPPSFNSILILSLLRSFRPFLPSSLDLSFLHSLRPSLFPSSHVAISPPERAAAAAAAGGAVRITIITIHRHCSPAEKRCLKKRIISSYCLRQH